MFFAHDINIDKLLLVAALVESLGRLEYGIILFNNNVRDIRLF